MTGGAVVLTFMGGALAGQFHHHLGVAPILGAVLCAACLLKPRHLFLVGLGGMLIRDLLLGLSPFTLVRLVGMALVVAALLALKVRPTFRSLFTGLVVSSPIFHLTLAVGDWATGTCGIWPRTPEGLVRSIATSIPYFQRAFVGDLFFAALFLGFYTVGAYAVGARKARALSG